jgi:hypothetical protein
METHPDLASFVWTIDASRERLGTASERESWLVGDINWIELESSFGINGGDDGARTRDLCPVDLCPQTL